MQKIKSLKLECKSLSFLLIYSLFNLVFYNIFFWKKIFTILTFDVSSILLAITFILLVFTIFLSFFSLIFNKYTLKPLAILFVICNGAAFYFISQYGISIDKAMLINVLETDRKEATDLLNYKMLGYFIILIVIPSYLIIKTKISYEKFLKEFVKTLGLCLGVFLLTLMLVIFQYRQVSTFIRESRPILGYLIPNSYVTSVIKIIKMHFKHDAKIIPIDPEASILKKDKNILVVLVIGETARAKNFSLYDYERKTNPLLEKDNILVVPNTSSCGTSTAASLPCIFSFLGRDNFTRSAKLYEPFTSFIAKFGVNVLWLGNNSGGCKGMCSNVATESFLLSKDQKFCSADGCVDGVMLPALEKYIKQNGNGLIVLHQNGSHGPRYNHRYPKEFEVFKPVCDRSDVSKCSSEELVNAYDNTILYTDYFLHEVIREISKNSKIPAVLIYASDHGESLGENGIYLHGFPYAFAPKEQKTIPFIIWTSDAFKKQNKIGVCLDNNKSYSHDNIFHSIVGIFGIHTKVYNKKLDIFSPDNCKK